MEMTDSIRQIKGIGEKMEKLFSKVGVHTVEELLHYYPRDYEVVEDFVPLAGLREGQTATVEVVLENTPKIHRVRNLKVLSAYAHDGSGRIMVTWFNMPYLLKQLQLGKKYIFRGKVIRKNGGLALNQPKILSEQEFYNIRGKWQPVYALTEGLTNNAVTKAVRQGLSDVKMIKEEYPLAMRREYDLTDHKSALRQIHFPVGKEEMLTARKRLVFEEFFRFMQELQALKNQRSLALSSYVMEDRGGCGKLLSLLPYSLTAPQMRTFQEIQKDMTAGTVMNRLVQGDVGSGKTVVAVLALLMVVENGYQGAIMVPTEVLAKQHMESFSEYLEPFGVKLQLLVGSMTAKEKREAYERIASGETDIIVGTHALIQEKVTYQNLALVVTDEQHRFGVRQRETFAAKGMEPHMLVMSATPIPRTLAVILYGDLDISIIDELPADRLPIKNCVVGTSYRPKAYNFIEQQVAEGRQVYVICPMVEESEAVEGENVMEYTERLREELPDSIVVEYLHGKMKAAEKNQIMEDFLAGRIQVLVSTTVVEVGINVPNATVMLIENAERFGLAQLHQLRGRVGRGKHQSYCIFMSGNDSKEAMERLQVLGKSNDGFYVAREDLRLRGPGDLFGVRQSGDVTFAIGDIFADADVLKLASEAVKTYGKEIVGQEVIL